MAVNIIQKPEYEPVTLQQLKDHLRIIHTEEDNIIGSYLEASRVHAEGTITWRSFVEQELELVLDRFPSIIRLPYPPVQSVTSITYTDRDNNTETIDAADYIVDTNTEPARIYPDERWPTVDLQKGGAVRVRYTAGYPLEERDVEGEAVGTGDGTETVFSLEYSPVVNGTETIYINNAAVAAADYTIDDDEGEITFNAAPADGDTVTADYTYEDYRYNIPTAIRQGVLLLAAHFYYIREPVVVGTIISQVPMTVENLLLPYRAWGAGNE